MWTKLLSFAVNASTIVWLLPFQKLLSLMGVLVAVINQLKKEKEKKDKQTMWLTIVCFIKIGP